MNRITLYITLFSFGLTVAGCSYFEKKETGIPVAKVNETYLYEEDIASVVADNLSKEDSALVVNNYINRWAKEQLLLDRAKLNLPEEEQKKFNRLINDYRKELFTEAYKDLLLSEKIDTTQTEAEIQDYFQKNQVNFKLNEDLVKMRYIQINETFPKLDEIKEKFERFNTEDKIELENEAIKFNTQSLNDSVWVSIRNIYRQIKPLDSIAKEDFLQKEKFLQLQDTSEVYLIYIKDVLLRNEKAPLEYVRPTIKQILLNKRKLELSKKIEKEIIEDALKNKQFEIYH